MHRFEMSEIAKARKSTTSSQSKQAISEHAQKHTSSSGNVYVFDNIAIIGSSHISKQSIREIKSAVKDLQPEVIAVELDRQRAAALIQGEKRGPRLRDARHIGIKGWAFAALASWISQKLGKMVGVMPGEEMKTAILLARKQKAKVALIDQDIRLTLKRISRYLTWRERGRFVADILKGLIGIKDPLLKKFDLRKVPSQDIINIMIQRMRERYPSLYRVLIDERNYVMARKLKVLQKHHQGQILAVMGAGHVKGVLAILHDNQGI